MKYSMMQKGEWRREDIAIADEEALNQRAKVVIALVEKWGMVAAMDDGEDSSGRHKYKLQPPPEVVQRAFEMTDLMWQGFIARGWIFEPPVPEGWKDLKPFSKS